MKKILIVTPKFPYPSYGACEQDRAAGIEMFKKMGYEVMVVTKIYSEEYKKDVEEVTKKLHIKIIPVCYKYLHIAMSWRKIIFGLKRLFQPWYWDGAAFEYSEPEIQHELRNALESFRPDIVWFDYTYLWPLYKMVRCRRIPLITRSINFEPNHFLEEDGRSIINYFKFLPKLLTEFIMSRLSNVVCAITPQEAELYKKIGARRVVILPLRGLSHLLMRTQEIHDRVPLNVFFSGSTYNVAHNRKALEFLLKQIVPDVQSKFPNQFIFHIFGGKIPKGLSKYFIRGVVKHDYLPQDAFEDLMTQMDIAIAPSLYGAGMQQKIFEPLSRGFPTITSARGLAGYPFKENIHLLLAHTSDEFVARLAVLKDIGVRRRLGHSARTMGMQFFSEESIGNILQKTLITSSFKN
ncbi:MAG: glycosyl transferase family 1 protein [Candidatus Peregrinibacteria bacterium GW2011_GWC2_39_14]|nr:MAG: glycosyl transferase family 1 protein [Candidatus Peregrinibacteria bacterium GW2011_GWC2_39_14]